VLRHAREGQGLTLESLCDNTNGRFRPSTVGGYERGERDISLRRFHELALVYGIQPESLMAQVRNAIGAEPPGELIIDLREDEMAGRLSPRG
jgi:transcriptional regulator with XRE-family HTH domain